MNALDALLSMLDQAECIPEDKRDLVSQVISAWGKCAIETWNCCAPEAEMPVCIGHALMQTAKDGWVMVEDEIGADGKKRKRARWQLLRQ